MSLRDGHTAHELARRGAHNGVLRILGDSKSPAVRGSQNQQCTARYARLGLCVPDSATAEQIKQEDAVIAAMRERRVSWCSRACVYFLARIGEAWAASDEESQFRADQAGMQMLLE